MRDAHRQYRIMRPLGWDWPRSLRYAWAVAKARQDKEQNVAAWIIAATRGNKGRNQHVFANI